jgi:hypothetical protein
MEEYNAVYQQVTRITAAATVEGVNLESWITHHPRLGLVSLYYLISAAGGEVLDLQIHRFRAGSHFAGYEAHVRSLERNQKIVNLLA